MRETKSITITLGEYQDQVDARVQSGAFPSPGDVIRAGLRALEREEAVADAVIRQRVQEALDDPTPSIPADQVFAELRAHHAKRMKAAKRDP